MHKFSITGKPLFGLYAASLLIHCAGFRCPPQDYEDMAATIPLAGNKVFLPIYKYEPADKTKIRLAIIALHGAGRNGNNYHGWVTNAMTKQEMQESAVVITPVFPHLDCTAADWTGDATAVGRGVKWSHSTRQWVFGATSDGYGDWSGISSYQAIDDVVEYVETQYKGLLRIVVTGFSAGAQMGLRWSILSLQGTKGVTLGGTPLTAVLGSPSSVTYLSEIRPIPDCSILGDKSDQHSCTDFQRPKKSLKMKTCKGKFNRFPFGTGGLLHGEAKKGTTRSDIRKYVRHYIKDDSLMEAMLREHFATKDVVFMFGNKDTKNCIVGACADDCGAMLQGTSRLQRGLNYMSYLETILPGYKAHYAIFNGGHRPELFFASDMFNQKTFNKLGWNECLWDDLTCFSLLWKGIIAGVVVVSIISGSIVGLIVTMQHNKKGEDGTWLLGGGTK